MSTGIPPGAHVEIVDPTTGDNLPGLMPKRVLINGTDVGVVAADGVRITGLTNDEDVVTVTLTLLPARVTIRGQEQPPLPACTCQGCRSTR